MNDQLQQLMSHLPAWAQEPAVLIGAGVVVALLLLWLLSRLFRGRPPEDHAEAEYVEEVPVTRPITPPPVTSAPPPIAEEPVIVPPVVEVVPEPEATSEPAPGAYAAPEPAPEPAPVAHFAPEPETAPAPKPEPAPEPAAYVPPYPEPEPARVPAEEAPEPAPLADEPLGAAAPYDASPATIAADLSSPEPEPQAEPAPVADEEPAPQPIRASAPRVVDDLTQMKGVGPRLAERLGSVGISSFAQIAALTPEEADALDARLGDFQGRIHRDRWIEQAGYLANGDVAGFEEVFGKL